MTLTPGRSRRVSMRERAALVLVIVFGLLWLAFMATVLAVLIAYLM